ncbi:MAG TPA: Glu-tRNA(Gln) amidotransferase subunit GatE [Nanoarchaeota archaeon]|nr:Glu-tRNA(Gln) amidotransferase subunit GatE [Candidatus Woesearchaeota archaeon]HIH15163.1 Glu-tRNA(Gln) amidotransferase subunit GatE [Nanoarchaeota archaeon]HIH59429.1 Glu-tRNA(Gln) amidotransferase subunit GatE [Nanoarchaeota archaeon]HII13827.1 Glu-tRNA(Gln) amidotransferase subunit GatE [Nanoarchaeota archaeon]HIJ04579.1 Glu-tRNA(Gln) amidotransferase subunit GatE [Nanoarchaeota archaeon]
MSEKGFDYKGFGFKCGLECHQQIESNKLFCSCPSLVNDDAQADIFFSRKLRAAAGETGLIDQAAAYEMQKGKTFQYEACSSSSCLVEFDEEPPHLVNMHALKVALEVSLLLHAKIVEEIHFMRKTVVDGSNVSGFQRTALIAMNGYIDTSQGRVTIPSICLEEEAAKKLEGHEHLVKFRLDRLGVALVEIATDASIQDPEHAKEVASLLGMILRSTGKVKRGLGTIRQDVNISIAGHPRVEVKGFQELRYMPTVIQQEITRQIQEAKKGEAHVRKANPDGTSSYLRPMPGAARMYPETDIPPIPITKELLASITLPELLDAKALRYEKDYALSAELARMLVAEDVDFPGYVKEFPKLETKFLAYVLVNTPKEIQKRYSLDITKLRDGDYREVLGYFSNGLISKEAVLDILVEILQGKKIDLHKYKAVDEKTLEKELKELIIAHKDAPFNALMGEAMKKYRGKVDGQKIMELLKKLSS